MVNIPINIRISAQISVQRDLPPNPLINPTKQPREATKSVQIVVLILNIQENLIGTQTNIHRIVPLKRVLKDALTQPLILDPSASLTNRSPRGLAISSLKRNLATKSSATKSLVIASLIEIVLNGLIGVIATLIVIGISVIEISVSALNATLIVNANLGIVLNVLIVAIATLIVSAVSEIVQQLATLRDDHFHQ